MSPKTYTLIDPVEVSIVTPGNENRSEKTEKRTITELPMRPIGGKSYFDLGEISFTATTPGGGLYEVENDAVIAAYLERQFVDPKDPASRPAFEALGLNDAMTIRQNLVALIEDAANAAYEARKDAPDDCIRLLEPPVVFGQPVADLRLRPPTHAALRRFGLPFFRGRLADGATQYMEKIEVIGRYLDGCIDHEQGKMLINQISLTDAMQIKMAVSRFFTKAALVAAGARKSTNSSSEQNTSSGAMQTA